MIRHKGFSLVEILIALGIISIITVIAIPVYNSHIQISRENVAKTNLETLRLAEEAYVFETNTYLAGTYNPAVGLDGLSGPLGWSPDGDDDKYVYVVQPCPAGTIATCYTITVTGPHGVSESYTRN